MYNPNEPHAAFQTLAAQAMVASAAGTAANPHRLSDVSDAHSVASRTGDDMGGYVSPGAGRRKPQKGGALSPAPFPAAGAANRFSMPPRLDGAPMPELPRPARPSTQSRRSQQAYAGRRSAAPGTAGTRRSLARTSTLAGGPTQESGEIDDLDWRGEDEKATDPADIKRRRFWLWFWVAAPLLVSLIFVAAGVVYLVYGSDQMVSNLQIWRLCFFIAGLPLIWWIGGGVVLAAVWSVENSKLFRMQNVLYFVYAVRRPLANVLRAVLALGWWALMMSAWGEEQDAGVKDAVHGVLLVWACVTLFMTANLVKTLLAKALALKFNKELHVQKIQESLVREYYLHAMLQPRDRGDGGADAAAAAFDGPDSESQKPNAIINTSKRGLLASFGGARSSGGASAGVAAGPPARTWTSSMYNMASRCFYGPPATSSGGSSAGEELLPSPGFYDTDVEAPGTSAAAPVDTSHQPLRSIYGVTPAATPTPAPAHGPSVVHVTATAAVSRVGSAFSGGSGTAVRPTAARPGGARASRLAPVVEEAAEEQAAPRGLTITQIVKMESYVRRHALSVTFHDELTATARREEVTSEAEAKKLAFFLFWNVKADLDRPYLIADDVADFMSPGEAETAFAMLDRNSNGSVTLAETIAAVVEIFEARCDLALSLKDARTVVGKLEGVLAVVVHFLFVFLYLLVFNVDVVKTYLALSSLILAFSFIFQNSIRTMYENVVFLFVVHPFDVGDVLAVGDGATAETYKVDQIDLHYTIFLAGNGARTWYANQKLMATPFANVSASGERGDAIKVLVDIDTPAATLDALRNACEAATAANPKEFAEGSVSVHLRDAANPLKVTVVLGFRYSHNGSEGGRTATARTLMHVALCEALAAAGVRYTNPPTREDPVAAAAAAAQEQWALGAIVEQEQGAVASGEASPVRQRPAAVAAAGAAVASPGALPPAAVASPVPEIKKDA